jgi:pantoate--beta-alanine ligase
MKVIEDVNAMKEFSKGALADGETLVLVPTMGSLHDGHRELLKIGKASGLRLVLSIFVNPTQFEAGTDFSSYPRDIGRDLVVAAEEGVDCVFCPPAEEIFPKDFNTYVEVGRLAQVLCGPSRPGHFRGVATVVLKLFNIVMPALAVFGKKDFQQLRIIEKMVEDLALEIEIIEAETVREDDGLAMSSRNRYLSALEREAAAAIPRALDAASALFSNGERQSAIIIEKMKKIIEKAAPTGVEYINVVDPQTLEDIDVIDKKALVAVAARFGSARLIDNIDLC